MFYYYITSYTFINKIFISTDSSPRTCLLSPICVFYFPVFFNCMNIMKNENKLVEVVVHFKLSRILYYDKIIINYI